MPSTASPKPPTMMPTKKIIMNTVVTPARNLALITASRCMGWETSRFSVPCERSRLMASKPMANPASGARYARNEAKEGMELPLAVYSARNRYSLLENVASEMLLSAPYRLARLVRISSAKTSLKRALWKWSASSFL